MNPEPVELLKCQQQRTPNDLGNEMEKVFCKFQSRLWLMKPSEPEPGFAVPPIGFGSNSFPLDERLGPTRPWLDRKSVV